MPSRSLISLLQRVAGRFGFTVKRRRPGILRESGEILRSISPASLMEAIHGKDIYEGFDHTAYPQDRSGWGGDSGFGGGRGGSDDAALCEGDEHRTLIGAGQVGGGGADFVECLHRTAGKPGKFRCVHLEYHRRKSAERPT
jgi:hypothetical protein